MSRDFRRDKHIDLNVLEWECARQHELYDYWGNLWAEACKKRDSLAEKVKTTRSRILENIRTNWMNLGFEKAPTDKQSEAFYRCDEEYIKVKADWVEAEANSRKLYVATRSMEHRKDMLGIEQRLYSGEYYSLPYTEPTFAKKVEAEHQKQTTEELNKEDGRTIGNRLLRRK